MAPADEATDAELIRQGLDGDRVALGALLRRHEPRLRVLCRRLCGNDGDAEDALQESMVAILRGLDRYDGRSSFATWAYRVTTNACLDELRRRRRRPRPVEDVPEVLAPEGDGPHADARGERDALLAALAALPEEFRAVVVLRDVLDLDYADIAATLDLAPGTVRSRIARGRARLADALGAGNQPGAPTVQQGGPT